MLRIKLIKIDNKIWHIEKTQEKCSQINKVKNKLNHSKK